MGRRNFLVWMGIQGLLPLLTSITEKKHIGDYRGKRVAVDAYVWLHRGAYSCSRELCQGIPTEKYVDYCMYRVNLLKHHEISPLIIFDGGLLPAKKVTEASRYKIRKEYKKKALEKVNQGNFKEATDCFQKAVEISPEVAQKFIQKLQQESVDFIVAPYEADAQLAYLSINGLVDAVITEDSDLLAFGCHTVLFKMDKGGYVQEIQLDRLKNCSTPADFTQFSMSMFRQMCILSGCDYLPSLPGLGIRTAHSLIRSHTNYKQAIRYLRDSKRECISIEYEEKFEKAELTFLYQRVWDPRTRRIVHLLPLPDELIEQDLSFLGPPIDNETGFKIANGEINPFNHIPWRSKPAAKPVRPKPIPHSSSSDSILPIERNIIGNYTARSSSRVCKPFFAPRKLDESLPTPEIPLITRSPRMEKTLLPSSPETPSPKKNTGKRINSPQKAQSPAKLPRRSLDSDFQLERTPPKPLAFFTDIPSTPPPPTQPDSKNQVKLALARFRSKRDKKPSVFQ